MTVSVAQLDAMPAPQADELLAACCGARRWVNGVVSRRPFRSRAALLAAADLEFGSLTPADWREAFSHHPRIGEQADSASPEGRGMRWSAGEQRGVDQAGPDVRHELSRVNREYEGRFGYVYIVCATGKSADEMLTNARARLANDAESELAVSAGEQQKITRLRLEKLLR